MLRVRPRWALWLLAGGIAILLSGCGTPGGAPVVSRHSTSTSYGAGADYYRVRRGDSLYSIAWRVGVDFRKLASWNGIRSPYTIYPGQRLRLKPQRVQASRKTAVSKSPARQSSTASQKQNKSATQASRSQQAAAKNSNEASTRKLQWVWPTDGKVVQRYSSKDPTRKGLKIAGLSGQPIRAAESGKVVYSGSGLIGYGRLIIVKHDRDYLTAYGHNRKVLVKEGDRVAKGDRIAEMGNAGGGNPVLHFEIRRKGAPVDPIRLLPARR